MTLRRDQRAVINLGEVFTFLLPYLKKLYARLKKEFVFISLWHGHAHRYIYHIHPPLRDAMYDYLEHDHILKKFGLAFGNDKMISSRDNLLDIGIYALLPFYEIYEKRGNDLIDGRKVSDVCREFAQSINNDSKSGSEASKKYAESLIKFVLEKCADEKFAEMLIESRGEFAGVYNELYNVANEKPQPKKEKILARFLKGSFRGMYINSEGFVGLALSTDKEAMESQIGEIASKIGPAAVKGVRDAGKMSVFQKLIAIFNPKEKRENVALALDRKFYMSVIMTDIKRYRKLDALFNSFKNIVYGFDLEVGQTFKRPAKFYKKVPVIVDIYRDENSRRTRSVCSALNDQIVLAGGRNNIQQIKFSPARFGGAKERCKGIVMHYYCMDMSKELPSEQGKPLIP